MVDLPAFCLLLPFFCTLLLAQGCRAQQPWPLYESYSKRFIDDQGRVIDRSAPGAQQDRTTSEGQAYAMFFALVDNDKGRFEHLLSWTEANLAGGDLTLRLPAWEWGHTASGDWKVIDNNSAADADLWLTYDLLEAGRLWHDPRYSKLGELLATRIAHEEVVLVPGLGTTLAPGPHGFHPHDQVYVLNPSYLPLPVLTYLAHTLPHGPWGAVLESLPALLDTGMDHGFAMNWVTASPTGIHPSAAPAEPTASARELQPSGSYDAIRVYLWLGLADPGTPGLHNLLTQVSGMAAVMRTAATPPLEVDPAGTIVHADSPPAFSAAVVPYLTAMGMRAEAHTQADRLLATCDPVSGLPGRAQGYYDANLALFSTAWSEGRLRFERDGKLRLKWK